MTEPVFFTELRARIAPELGNLGMPGTQPQRVNVICLVQSPGLGMDFNSLRECNVQPEMTTVPMRDSGEVGLLYFENFNRFNDRFISCQPLCHKHVISDEGVAVHSSCLQ